MSNTNYQQMCDNIKAGTMTAEDLSEAFDNVEAFGYDNGFIDGYAEGVSHADDIYKED